MVKPFNSFGMCLNEEQNINIQPTIFHITHHKAGSQWVAEVLKHCVPDRIILPKEQLVQFFQEPIKPGGVYLTIYVSKPEFETAMASLQPPCRKFVVIGVIISLIGLKMNLKSDLVRC